MRKLLAAVLTLALAAPALAADEPGVFKIPGTESTIKFYGYVQLDTTLDFSSRVQDIEDNDWATNLYAAPEKHTAYAKKATPQLYMTARTSRFGLTTNTPTDFGPLVVKLEGDFNGPNSFQTETYTNSVLFRLRQAYGQLGGFLAGQTWSTFLDLSAYPDVVDWNGPGDLTLVRNPMLRYTLALAPGATLAVAAENTRGTQFGGAKFQTLPDFHAALNYTAGWGHINIRGVTQQFNWFESAGGANPFGGTYPTDRAAKKFGVSGAVSGSAKLGGDTLVAQFTGGQGIGRYLLNAAGANFVATGGGGGNVGSFMIESNGDLKLVTTYAYHVGFTHVWNKAFRSNLVWSQTFIQDPKANGVPSDNTVQKDLSQAFVNTFWGFTKNAELSLEYVWGQWKSFTNGTPERQGDMNRINMTLHYNFY